MPGRSLGSIPLLLVLAAGCTPRRPEPARPDPAAAVRLGSRAAGDLRAALLARVSAALRAGGPAAAIDVCSREAEAIATRVASSLPAGVTIRRTSLKVRNPRNAPDAVSQAALEHFARIEASGAPRPAHHLVTTPDGVRYYEPIGIAGPCLSCHGPAERIAPAVQAVLRERYPADQATGYRAGELRGLYEVVLPAAALR
jgi:hypothetical protein